MALSDKQRKIIEFIGDFIHRHSYPPSVREVLKGGGISSTSVVAYNLNLLERQGYIARDKEISRGIRLLKGVDGQPFTTAERVSTPAPAAVRQDTICVPALGRVTA